MWPVLAGLVAGAGHAVSGPDHLAAVLPLATQQSERAAWTGLMWGMGHGVGVVVLGALGFLARPLIDVERISGHAEWIVGGVLVLTGLWAIVRALRPLREAAHVGHGLALGIGVLHGAAGGAHVVVVIGALALPAGAAIGWLLAFLVGAAGAMAAVGWLTARSEVAIPRAAWWRVQVAAGGLAVVVGAIWAGTSLVGAA